MLTLWCITVLVDRKKSLAIWAFVRPLAIAVRISSSRAVSTCVTTRSPVVIVAGRPAAIGAADANVVRGAGTPTVAGSPGRSADPIGASAPTGPTWLTWSTGPRANGGSAADAWSVAISVAIPTAHPESQPHP